MYPNGRPSPVRAPFLAVALAGLLAPWSAAAQEKAEPEQEPEQAQSMRQLSEQGGHYYRRKMLAPAMASLEKARALPGGEQDYRTLSTLARVYFDLVLLEKAFPTAQAALQCAAERDEKEEAEQFAVSLEERFGGVTFRKAREQVGATSRGIIHLEDRGGLIDPQKKKVFEKIADRFRDTQVELPYTLYLPFGSYAANRAPFVVEKGKIADVEMILDNPQERRTSAWWYVAGGALILGAATTVAVLLIGRTPPQDTQALQVGDVRLRGAPAAPSGGDSP